MRRFAALLLLGTGAAVAHDARVLDDFGDASAWQAVASDQVSAVLRHIDGALCLAYDFNGVSGYAGIRRTLAIDYPRDYAFDFRVRGKGPPNAFQFKLSDASGENVWWVERPNTTFAADWQPVRYKQRQIAFAWGPRADKTLARSESVEFTIYANSGGAGEFCVDALTLRERDPPAPFGTPKASASSSRPGAPAAFAVDADPLSAWRSDARREQRLVLDFGRTREFGGLTLRWTPGEAATRYAVDVSDDAKRWTTQRVVVDGNGGDDALLLTESEARYVRLRLAAGEGKTYGLRDVAVEDLAFGANANAFFRALAQREPRGRYPRGFSGEQSYWTLLGVDGGSETGLMSEDGAVELSRGGFSVEPFVLVDDARIATWADVRIEQSLADGYLPMPRVMWRGDGFDLDIAAFADGDARQSNIVASYTLRNTSDRARRYTLALAVQPFQVNPPAQFLSTPGGVAPIRSIAWNGRALAVDGRPRIRPLTAPDAFFATVFDAGMATSRLLESPRPGAVRVDDTTGFASGVFLYAFDLDPGAARTIGYAAPLIGEAAVVETDDPAAWLAAAHERTAATWRATLDRVRLTVPPAGRALADSVRTALAHILISRDGPMLRPGTRSYARSWIRDGAMIAEGLLRLGDTHVAREYLEWYAPYQFKNGKVPCCVDARGADPVPENDSHGELIHLAWLVYRYGGDRTLLAATWPRIEAAVAYMDTLRRSEQSDKNRTPERHALYGLMPASISHEGYSAKPMHSYWDDFWALTGYKDAASAAQALGRDTTAIARSRDEFRDDLHASIRAATAQHGIDFIPGAAELGDFDATSTTIALAPAGEQRALPQNLLHNTFERYWREFVARRDGVKAWKDYTPYEWRTVGTFVRLGWRARATEAIDFFLRDRRPAAWNQWAEVVGRDPREVRFIGDMPHAWVASDFLRAALDLFAYERSEDRAMVLAAGVPAEWLAGDGVAIERLRTPYGALSYSLRRDATELTLVVERTDFSAPGGLVLTWPLAGEPGRTTIDGRAATWRDGELSIGKVPAKVVVKLR